MFTTSQSISCVSLVVTSFQHCDLYLVFFFPQIKPKHLSCVSLSCLHMAAKVTEEECNLTPADELIRIGQCRFTVSDLRRMEKIVAEKLNFKSKAVTALTFLHLYHQITMSHAMAR